MLVVEHDEVLRELLRRALQRRAHHVLVAANVPSALALLEHAEAPIDLVIADVLPGMNGDELAVEFRRRSPTVAVLLISSGVNEPFATPELDKPFTLAELERRVIEVVSG